MGASDTHRREPLLAPHGVVDHPTTYETTPMPASNCLRGGICSMSPGAGVPLPLPDPSHPSQELRQAHDDTAMSSCLRGGIPSVSPGTGGTTSAPWHTSAITTDPRRHRREQLLAGCIPTPSSAPVFDEVRNCGSSQTQELLHDGRQWVYPYLLTHGS